jgi:hypothetical protein
MIDSATNPTDDTLDPNIQFSSRHRHSCGYRLIRALDIGRGTSIVYDPYRLMRKILGKDSRVEKQTDIGRMVAPHILE